MHPLTLTIVLLVVLGLLGALIVMLVRRKKQDYSNVTDLSSYKKQRNSGLKSPVARVASLGSKPGKKCSHCKKTAKKITFYADDQGTVIGLCPDCQAIAVKRDLMPL